MASILLTAVLAVVSGVAVVVAVGSVVLGRLRKAHVFAEVLLARLELDQAHADLARAQRLSGMATWDWDLSSDVVTWSDQYCTLIGADPASFTPTVGSLIEHVHPEDRDWVEDVVRTAFSTGTGLDLEFRLVRDDGVTRHVHALGALATDAQGDANRFFGTVHDVTERSLLQLEIERLAFNDPLTGLANRRLFMDRLRHALAGSERSGRGCTVLFVDLDDFKSVNDSFGHQVGDEYLCEVARRLTSELRAVDTIARLGGDEFAILCEDLDSATATVVVDRVRERLGRPVVVDGTEIALGGSIGIARAMPGLTGEDVLRLADRAMYVEKARRKRSRVVVPEQPSYGERFVTRGPRGR